MEELIQSPLKISEGRSKRPQVPGASVQNTKFELLRPLSHALVPPERRLVSPQIALPPL